MKYGREILEKWNLNPKIYYINHGSFGATPKAVIDEALRITLELEKEPVNFFMEDYPGLLNSSREKLAKVLHLDSKGLVLIENATSGANIILRSLVGDLKKGDKILISSHVYPAVKLTLDYIESVGGIEIITADAPFPVRNKDEVFNSLKAEINSSIKIAIFDHISSATSLVNPVKKLVAECKKHGIITIIDGAHAPGMIDLDIEDIGCDFYIGNCHKWMFALKGCAMLWATEAFRDKLHPLTISHNYKKGFLSEFEWVGTRNPSSWLSLPTAIDFYNDMGGANIREYNHNLAIEAGALLETELSSAPAIPEEMTGSILSFPALKNYDASQEQANLLRKEFLSKYNIELMFTPFKGRMYFRISAQIYNDIRDYEKLVEAMKTF